VEGGKESQQAPRGRNWETSLEMVWEAWETDTQTDEGAGEEHCNGSEAQV